MAWEIQKTIDQLVIQGDMQELIVVAPYNDENRTMEYTYNNSGDAILDYYEYTVAPWIQSQLRVYPLVPPASRWGLFGSSLGGLMSCYAGWTRAHMFDRVICMSSSFWWDNEGLLHNVLSQQPASGLPDLTWYLDSGDAGPDQDDKNQTLAVRAKLEQYGYKMNETLYYYLDHGGQHNELYWGARFHYPMSWLYPPEPVVARTVHLAPYVHA